MNEEDEKIKKIRLRVRKIKEFYKSLIRYFLVNLLLLMINIITNPNHLWFLWVALVWGIIILVQAFNTFTIRDSFLGDEWEERKVKELAEKEKDE